MHTRRRHQLILETLSSDGLVTVRELTSLLGASSATIRRDLNHLAAAGHLQKVHGGAENLGQPQRRLGTPTFRETHAVFAAAKSAIAEAAAALVRDGDSIIITGGTTTFRMSEFLHQVGLNILTNSFAMARRLEQLGRHRVMIPGGEIYRDQGLILSPHGPDPVVQHFNAAKMFTGAHAIGRRGLIEGDPLIIESDRRLLEQADELVVLIDSSKFQMRGSQILCPISQIARVITDDGATPEQIALLRDAGLEVTVVSPDPSP